MKTILLFTAASIMALASAAQSEKYVQAMKTNIAAIENTHTPAAWNELANSFQRIADSEKSQWLPYYYAAFSTVMNGYSAGTDEKADAATTDPLADRAEELLNKAQALLNGENSEVYIIKKMIATLRMTVDPQTRWQTYGTAAAEALAKAKALNPENPRVLLLEGQDKFYTPEQFGGSKTEAKVLFEEAIKKFESFKPASELDPAWGLDQAKYFYGLAK